MPNNSNNSINSFSPNFRDALLTRNLLADSVKNNSLSSWLDGINKPVGVENIKGPHVQSSPDIEVDGPLYRTLNTKFGKSTLNTLDYYKRLTIPYVSRDIIFEADAKYTTAAIASPTSDGPFWRDTQNTVLNLFKTGNKEYYGNGIISYKDSNIITNTDYITLFAGTSDPETDGVFRRELSITQNQYKSPTYSRVDFVSLPFETNPTLATLNLNPNVYAPTLEAYTALNVPASGPFLGGDIRQFNTAKNMYLDVPKQTRTIIDTSTVTEQLTSYIDYNNSLAGGKATQLIDVIGSVLGGGGVGFDPNSGNPVPDFDVRSSLAGRALTSAGVLKDTRLGQISSRYLAAAIGNNIAFNLQEETIGRVNTNILSLAMGGDLIVPNNKITVKDGGLGFAADILERMTGAKIPVSLLPDNADIFTFKTKSFVGIGNIERANAMLRNTGKGTVQSLFGNIKSNINPNLIGLRNGYAPGFNDDDGNAINQINGNWDNNIYAFAGPDGTVINLLSLSSENSPVAASSHKLSGINGGGGFSEGPNTTLANIQKDGKGMFTWSDTEWNKLPRDKSTAINGNDFTTKKTLLHRTQQLFNSSKMRTLVSGKGLKVDDDRSEIETPNGPLGDKTYMSKGSGVLKNGGINLGKDPNPDEIFVRAWSPVDTYSKYEDLQKHSALTKDGRNPANKPDVESSVLEEFGIVKIGPHRGEKIKKFMFSIENLAWADNTTQLIDCEKGPGDPISGTKGRIMWFPPYDMVINESTSANWDRTNFIGRGEPIYTYNNSERTGTLAWKIIVDHPNYLNYLQGKSNDEIAAFFAGALEIEEIRNSVLNDEEKEVYNVRRNNQPVEGALADPTLHNDFKLYLPNDNNDVLNIYVYQYENGINKETNKPIDQTIVGENLKNGVGTTKANGGVSTDGTNYTDNTNFGLNATPIILDGEEYNVTTFSGYTGFYEAMEKYMNVGNCKYCSVKITGYASEQGNGPANEALALKRANIFKTSLIDNSGVIGKRIKTSGEVITGVGCVDGVSTDSKVCKESRGISVTIDYDSSLEVEANPRITTPDKNEPPVKYEIPISRFYNECDYFDNIKAETDSFVNSEIKSKIKNFHPAFHSITPEGFNSRLTFLQQCMRQGPTISGGKPDNLAFGRPPVCILRIGDFYHTKIIIESLTIDYEPLVWDLNPEGVGVQPMIANVNISFAFIGGSSMKGPINRLQNAVSFNYFANTELYDPRAEKVEEKAPTKKKPNIGKIVEGHFPGTSDYIKDAELLTPINGKNQYTLDMEAEAAAEAKRVAEEEARLAAEKAKSEEEARLAAIENDKALLRGLSIVSYKNHGDFVGFNIEIVANKSDKVEATSLTTKYEGEVYITNSLTNEQILIGLLSAESSDDTTFKIETTSYPDGTTEDTTFYLEFDPTSIGLINFGLFDHPDYDTIMSLLEPCGEVKYRNNNIGEGYFEPCPDGDHRLTMKWTDGKEFRVTTNRVYNKENNGKSI